ncbi:MAG: cation diffusion facilitator family transporter [Candidatus Gastranaerophilales bacterium]|nr:cation diffusion facilitator family transporter [Candidatus Gastranaerophilales bacterium]
MTSDSSSSETLSVPQGNDNKDFCPAVRSKQLAIIRAFIANIGIATIKLVCWLFSGSSALLSEAAHSFVDSFNSICLMIGLKRGSKPADEMHPFGYGLEANIWALFASILMLAGTAIAIGSGVDKILNSSLHNPADLLKNYPLMALTLLVSMCFEAWAVNSAMNAVLVEANVDITNNKIKDYMNSVKQIKHIKSPTTKFVWYEDSSALLGVIIAFIGLSVSKFLLPDEFVFLPDAIASILIGCILFFLAIYMLKNNVNFLTGQSAEPQIEDVIRRVASTMHGIACVHELKTMDMGTSGLIVNMTIEVDPEIQVKDADDIADMLERKIRNNVKNISHVAIEIQADDAEENWEDKFDKIIQEGEDISLIDNHEAKMLSNFYSFSQTVVKEVMVPRPKIVFVDAESSLLELMDIIIDSGHTRIPIYEDNVDNIIGVVNAKDVLKAVRDNAADDFAIKELAREIPIIPENKFISDLLSDFTSSKTQIAAVVDEHGGIAGIVTVEDILEEIVGEIYDEFDEAPVSEIIKIDDKTMNVSSQIDIDDMNERFDLDIPNEDFQTLGGYVFGLLGKEPEIGNIVEDRNITYKVIELDGRRISRVIMHKNTPFIDALEKEENEENEKL